MKTSVIEVHDMLAVLTVDGVEKRFGEVPGIESATVNYAGGNATVRYDETLLDVADIKILVHQRGQHGTGDSKPDEESKDKPVHRHDEDAMPDAAATSPEPAATIAARAAHAPAAEGQQAEPASGTPSSSAATEPSV